MEEILLLPLFCGFISVSMAGKLEDFGKGYQRYEVSNPLSGHNRMVMRFNVGLYTYVIRPALKGYSAITPSSVRSNVRNSFDSLLAPFHVVGNVSRLKFDNASDELKRFIANFIMGFGGLRNTVSEMEIREHPADLGLVLVHWGVGKGFHIVLPILGSSNLGDTLSLPTFWCTTPMAYVEPDYASFLVGAYGLANELSFHLDEIDKIYYNTPNLYPFLRNVYEQRRRELSK